MPEASSREWKPTPEAEGLYRRWIANLNDQFTKHQEPSQRAEIVRDELYQIYLGRPHGQKSANVLTTELASNVLAECFDPANAMLEADRAGGFDPAIFEPRRPLIWFWQMFDRSALGLNLWLGFRFRCMLAQHIFKKVGKGAKIYPEVRFTYGYNITLEDNVCVRRGVMLDDREPLTVQSGSSVSEGERVSRP